MSSKIETSQRLGKVFVLCGLFIPCVLFPLTKQYGRPSFLDAIRYSNIYLVEGTHVEGRPATERRWDELQRVWIEGQDAKPSYDTPSIAIPYKYPLILGIILFFLGIYLLWIDERTD